MGNFSSLLFKGGDVFTTVVQLNGKTKKVDRLSTDLETEKLPKEELLLVTGKLFQSRFLASKINPFQQELFFQSTLQDLMGLIKGPLEIE